MSDEAGKRIDGIYSAYFAASAGISVGLYIFREGEIFGADIGGMTYDGNFKISENGQHIVGTVRYTVPIGTTTITGLTAGNEPLEFEVPINLPVELSEAAVYRIDTPAGPVNAKFKKLRGL